jgi:tetratricopeptide (TPR) repeat protein
LTRHQELITFWEQQSESHQEVSSSTIHFVAWSYIHLGNLKDATQLAKTWLTKDGLSLNDMWNLLEIQASLAFFQGHYQEAETYYNKCLSLGLIDNKQDIANVLRNRSVTRMQLGLYPQCLPDLEQALTIYSEAGNSIYYAQTLVMTSYVYQELGDTERTEDVLVEAISIFRQVEPQPFLVHALVQLGSLYVETPNRIFLAQKYASESRAIARQLSDKSCYVLALHANSRVALAIGKPSEALELANEMLTLSTDYGIYEATVNAHAARASALIKLGEKDQGIIDFQTALEMAKQRGMTLEAHTFGLELDRLNDNVAGAKQKMQWFADRNLQRGVKQAQRLFPELAQTQTSNDTAGFPKLEVLGSLRIQIGGKPENVQGRKRQELLLTLLEARMAGRSEVSRLTLYDLLYADKNESKATSSLKELVHSLRDRLGQNVITTSNTGYALGAIHSDAEQFLQRGDSSLWRGPYEGLEHQPSVTENLYGLLQSKVEILIKTNSKEAARLARILLEHDPYNHDYLKLCLRALHTSQNYRAIKQVYAEATKRMSELGETLPENWESFLN